jgi:hypothetical protein
LGPDTPRVPGIELDWAVELETFLHQQLAVASDPDSPPPDQARHLFTAGYYQDLALIEYALGKEPGDVRRHFRQAAEEYLRVFELRATLAPFSADRVIIPLSQAPAQRQPLHADGELDESLTNSRTGLTALYVALIGAGTALARRLAPLIADPPDATYLGVDSVVCTYNDQHLAYAVKALLLDDPGAAGRELEKIQDPDPGIESHARLIRALQSRADGEFLAELRRHLGWHAQEARQPGSGRQTALFMDIPALALYQLALSRSLVRVDRGLEQPYFPAGLLGAGLGGAP